MENVEDIYELSPMQHGMLFDSVTMGDSGMYLIQLEYLIGGALDVERFRAAWQAAADRHAILRTSFHWEEMEKPLQVVHSEVEVAIATHDWSALSPEEQETRLADLRGADRALGVEFDQAPLMRLALYRLGPESHRLLWSFHHILFEGWSAARILEEVLARYEALGQGVEPQVETPRPYRDYVTWFQAQDPARAEAYWREQLAGYEGPTHLGIDQKPSSLHEPVTDYGGERRELGAAKTAALRAFAQSNGLTLNTLVQGAWALLLSIYTRQEDVVFGSVVSGRSIDLEGVDKILGLFINVLPSRVRVPCGAGGETRVIDWLRELQERQVRQREFEHCSLAEIKAWSDAPAGVGLFETILVFENWSGDLTGSGLSEELDVRVVRGYQGAPGYPLAAVVVPGNELSLGVAGDASRFDGPSIARMLEGLEALLDGFVANPEGTLAQVPLLDEAGRRRVLEEWNDTADDTLDPAPVHEQLAAQARRTPEAPAVEQRGETLSYAELEAWSNRVAQVLRARGVQTGQRVGLCVEREPSMLAGMLGILKAGASYVPLDPAYPAERLALLVEDSGVELVVTQARLEGALGDGVARLELEDAAIEQASSEPVSVDSDPEREAYVIYTSGSTGKPKGVMVPHRAVANYVGHAAEMFALTPADRVLQFASISFDTAVEEIFPTLVRGATLVLRTDEMIGSVRAFLEATRDQRLTVIDFPTAYWHAVVEGLEDAGLPFPAGPDGVRVAILGGERAKPEHLARWYAAVPAPPDGPLVLNTYGPTEGTVVATAYPLSPADVEEGPDGIELPIGKPVRNVQAILLDHRGQPVPVGVPGELHLGGRQLATGYLGREELTAERFVPHPFVPGERLYRTGDLARYRDDGNIEYVGRADNQVKFRGYRIELEEIEAALRGLAGVGDAVVLLREDSPGAQRLVAYVVTHGREGGADGGGAPSSGDLKRALAAALPVYMVPSAFVTLETLPLTPNGKVDRRALPAPEQSAEERGTGYQAPETPIEQQLAEIWREVLEVERVGLYDNFFDLGGHSLLLMTVIAEIEKRLAVRLTPGELVLPTIKQLGSLCEERLHEAQETKPEGWMKRLIGGLRAFANDGDAR